MNVAAVGPSMMRKIQVVTVCLTAGACAGGDAVPGLTVVDSAGISIVTNHSPTDPADSWRISAEPLVSIGTPEGDDAYLFTTIRAVGWLRDGRIYVADEGTHNVRIYSATGEHLRTVGREGQGPGEFTWFMATEPYRGDSLFVYDYARSVAMVFGPDFEYAREAPNPLATAGNYWILGALPDGRFLLSSFGGGVLGGGPGIRPDSSLIAVGAPDAVSADTIGHVQIGIRRVDARGRAMPVMLSPAAAIAVAGDGIIWSEGEDFSYVEADATGAIRRIVRRNFEPEPITPDVISEFKGLYVSWFEGTGSPEFDETRVREFLDQADYHDRLPAIERILVDRVGSVWVGRYSMEPQNVTVWDVFDSVGTWRATVETPPGLEVHRIRDDRIIGVALDQLGVPHVRIYGLARADP